MAREKKTFVCSDCGADYPQWEGKCGSCGAWNTLQEFRVAPHAKGKKPQKPSDIAKPQRLEEITSGDETRMEVGIGELDRVLGGGLVPGSAILIGGDPGIGKSTLLMQGMEALSKQAPVLYVSGEESVRQIKLRGERLGLTGEKMWVLMENRLESVLDAVAHSKPSVLVVDSIQTMASDALPSAAGSVTQVRECVARLIQQAKEREMPLFLVGHVTKEGQIAGPRVVEHMVDTVLYFEGERGHNYRILRAVKNRFGAANEIGVFEMREEGLAEVVNPSELFLSERARGASGSVVFPGLEGTRPVLVEIQALVTPSPLAQPRRTTLGFDNNRLAMLTAVLEKKLGLGLFNHDIFLNVAGGFRITEPAADLAVAAALFASHREIAVDPGLAILGEIGLSGEVRGVGHVGTRMKEAAKLGFNRCLAPARSIEGIPPIDGLRVDPASNLIEAMESLLGRGGEG
ncbi:MAG: DNA repair protein RadA [Magnetococcales bacterium]|nr:DNA repair protein RadA [Magnetococcales bacterium]